MWTEWEENGKTRRLTYGDVYHQNEVEQSTYNFEQSNTEILFRHFAEYESEAKRLMGAVEATQQDAPAEVAKRLALPAYEQLLKAAHTFNLLDARGAISVTERAAYIGRIRNLSRLVAQAYYDSRESLGFPMCDREATA